MNNGANKLFGVISESHDFLSWLHNEEDPAIKEMPEEYKENFKQSSCSLKKFLPAASL